MKKLNIATLAIATIFFFSSCSRDMQEPVKTVAEVDLNQYIGKWYEIGSIPQFFNLGCYCTTAEYDFLENGNIRVFNSCRLGGPNGILNTILGQARPQRGTTGNSKLEVKFNASPWAPYWIIELSPDYSYAVVTDPARGTYFILSRTKEISEELYQQLLEAGRAQGINVNKVRKTNQRLCRD
jgi:apolipoprotein D and lipocalin family protein